MRAMYIQNRYRVSDHLPIESSRWIRAMPARPTATVARAAISENTARNAAGAGGGGVSMGEFLPGGVRACPRVCVTRAQAPASARQRFGKQRRPPRRYR